MAITEEGRIVSRTVRFVATATGSLLFVAACGSGQSDTSTSQDSNATASDIVAACAEQEMIRPIAEVSSLADLVDVSNVVAEVEVVRRYEAPGITDEDPVTNKLIAELRVLTTFTGTVEGDTLTTYVAMATTDRNGEPVVLAGDEVSAALQVGQTGFVGLVGPDDGEYELTSGTLLIDGDTVAPVCPDMATTGALGQQVEAMDAVEVRTELQELGAAAHP